MFKSLFNVKFNWPMYLLAGIIIRLIFFGISWYSYFAVMITIYQFLLLFNAIGHVIPVRYLLGSFMCLQFFVGATLAYNGLDQYQYQLYVMRIPEEEYFSYVIPAVLMFIAGLHLNAGSLKGEQVDEKGITYFVQKKPRLPYFFIGFGFVSSIVGSFFSSELAFVFYLFGSFKFIGLFLLILGSKHLKPLPMAIVIGSIVSSSLGSGMFHDLLIWIVITASVYGIKYKFGQNIKIAGATAFIVLVALIQVMKGVYRDVLGGEAGKGGLETFAKLAQEQNELDEGLFGFRKLAASNVRINQGFIITNIMITVPNRVPFQNGAQMYEVFEAAILPRIIAPNKLKAGDRSTFTKYSGINLRQGTSMGLSSVGDAYINFGIIGGCFFMFFLGLMYNITLQMFGKYSVRYPILILFTALSFYYPIRPDCELQTILGHLFKSIMLITFVVNVWKNQFSIPLRMSKWMPSRPAL